MIDFPEDYGKTPEDAEEAIIVSKSQLKRDMHILQELGKSLVELPQKQLEKFVLPEVLRDSIILARRIKHREGHRRQLQYIGKIMRDMDVGNIQQQMDVLQQQSRNFRQHTRKLEQWRNRLIEEGDSALDKLLAEQPAIDRQHLRQLIRQAQKEQSQQKPPAASRRIFKYLRELFEN